MTFPKIYHRFWKFLFEIDQTLRIDTEIGKISKKLLEKINKTICEATKVKQWHKSEDTIKWFRNIKKKRKSFFVQFDIVEFYPSITKELLQKSLDFAKRYKNITEEQEQIILHSRKSLLFTQDGPWEKSLETQILMLQWAASTGRKYAN